MMNDAFRLRLREWAGKALHTGQHGVHMAYLGLVAVESHGLYGKAAGLLLILGIAAHFAGMGGGDD